MSKINILSDETIGKIAAGEVVERPASVVKELVENSIDAGSDSIEIELASSGQSLIRVADNGEGLASDDAKVACQRHTTSKIAGASDLEPRLGTCCQCCLPSLLGLKGSPGGPSLLRAKEAPQAPYLFPLDLLL